VLIVIKRKGEIVSESNKTLARRVFEAIWNRAELSLADEMYSGDYVAHIAHTPEAIRGVEAFKQFVALFHALYPDLQFTVEDQIAEGDKVATRWTARSPNIGADVAVAGISIHRLADGRFVESWDNWDAVGALQAMGPGVFEKIGLSM
jgi:predicted SnoaL-like aldol condensation-catalyzing enzyme